MSAVHHVEALERLFETCARALRPGDVIFLDEYLGPSRFQTGAHEQTIINWLLTSLPAHCRRNLFGENLPAIDVYAPASAAWFAENDPSKALRSAEIKPCLEHAFEIVVAFRPYGGAIMHHLLSGIAGNFDEEVELDRVFLEELADVEEALEEEGAIRKRLRRDGRPAATIAGAPELSQVSVVRLRTGGCSPRPKCCPHRHWG